MSDISNNQSITMLQQRYHQESDALITECLTPENDAPGSHKYDFVIPHNLNTSHRSIQPQDSSKDDDNPNLKASNHINSLRLGATHVAFVDAAIRAQ